VKVRSFKDLKVWKLSHKLSIEVSELVKTFPKDEKYDLADQMRRSSRSIPSEIAEGFGRFHFNDKLTFYERGQSSLLELRNHFEEAKGNKYINNKQYNYYKKKMNEIGFLLTKMMKNIRKERDKFNRTKL
jgi:four helix bundle protein